eukprot:10300034-Alexandrium_andersonii.AAC.1
MSASLVGSEMCIRDRVPRSLSGTSQPTRRASGQDALCWPNARGRSGPVSYTHLTLPTICSV